LVGEINIDCNQRAPVYLDSGLPVATLRRSSTYRSNWNSKIRFLRLLLGRADEVIE
jgi:hypothetical protein